MLHFEQLIPFSLAGLQGSVAETPSVYKLTIINMKLLLSAGPVCAFLGPVLLLFIVKIQDQRTAVKHDNDAKDK